MSTPSGDRAPQEATASGGRAPQEGKSGAGRRWRYAWLDVDAVWAALSTAYFCAYQSPHPISGPLRGWAWFWNPQETLAEMRLPSITTNLKSTHFAADGQRGWVVGEYGTILQTRDGGSTWTRQTSGTQSWLSSVSFAADNQRGWVVGEKGTIQQTRDGGASWTP